ncbi:hypothetical protein CAL7716_057030 [Calothrix sp. PCC 7716]|nr:hypothetical protein CAL7716_057030 [Calothrix sp. PCC 7716]
MRLFGKKIPAREHYTVNEDGLSQQWLGRVFLNPPYSCPGKWIAKLTEEIKTGRVIEAIALVPGATDTNWLSPVLKNQPVCFWKGRIKFLDTNYEAKLPARQSHVLIYWGSNSARFVEVFDAFGVVQLPSTVTNELYSPDSRGGELRLGIQNSPSNTCPSNADISPSKKRIRASGSIYHRTITKNGTTYSQAYYHWRENGHKRSKYIPKQLLGVIEQAVATRRPIMSILELRLGIQNSPSNGELLGEVEDSPSNGELLGEVEDSPSNGELLGEVEDSPSNGELLGEIEDSPSNLDNSPSKNISPSKMRHKGEGSGSIHWRIITKNGKDYPQAYYHYEFWSDGEREIKSTKYIPKRLLSQVQNLKKEKAPVKEVLELLGVVE